MMPLLDWRNRLRALDVAAPLQGSGHARFLVDRSFGVRLAVPVRRGLREAGSIRAGDASCLANDRASGA
jgi:hypothetical protein